MSIEPRDIELPPATVLNLAERDEAWCCLCNQFHPCCRFTEHSTHCIKPNCQNPHHRKEKT
jgi:hypothetical protein